MPKDWTGNKKSIYVTLAASSHTDEDREENDYYATEPKAVELLLSLETFNKSILEPACGEGHISEVLKKHGYDVLSMDLVDRGYGDLYEDFLKVGGTWDGDIITNPPYKYAQQFIEKSLSIIPDGNKVAMFLKVQFLEGKERKNLFIKKDIKTKEPKIEIFESKNIVNEKKEIILKSDFESYTNIWEYIKPKENTQAHHILSVVILDDWLDMDQIREKIKNLFYIKRASYLILSMKKRENKVENILR